MDIVVNFMTCQLQWAALTTSSSLYLIRDPLSYHIMTGSTRDVGYCVNPNYSSLCLIMIFQQHLYLSNNYIMYQSSSAKVYSVQPHMYDVCFAYQLAQKIKCIDMYHQVTQRVERLKRRIIIYLLLKKYPMDWWWFISSMYGPYWRMDKSIPISSIWSNCFGILSNNILWYLFFARVRKFPIITNYKTYSGYHCLVT